MENESYRRLTDSQIELDARREKQQLGALIRSRAVNLLSSYGKSPDPRSPADTKPNEFNDTLKIGKNRINFSLKSDDPNPLDADNIEISIPSLREALVFTDRNEIKIIGGDVRKDATLKHLLDYSQYITLIESQFPLNPEVHEDV